MDAEKEKTLEQKLQDALAENTMLRADVKELKKQLSKKNAVEIKPEPGTTPTWDGC